MHRRLITLLVVTLLTAFVPVGGASADEPAPFEVQVTPATAGNTAVRAEQWVTISGQAPAGASLTAARLIGEDDDGRTIAQEIPASVLNRRDDTGGNWLRNNAGTLEGSVRLGCRFGEPANCHERIGPVRRLIAEVAAEGRAARSAALRVDFTRPYIRRYDVVAPDRIVIVFSEPVRHPQGDSPVDWRIEDPERTVLRVLGANPGDCAGRYLPGEDTSAGDTGCTRTLVIAPPLGVGEAPYVRYRVTPLPDRLPHSDYAGNNAFVATGAALDRAVRRMRPAIPNIDAIDGKEPGAGATPSVTGTAAAPVVRVSNVDEGHDLFFHVTRPDGSVLTTESEPHRVDSGVLPQDVTLPALGADGIYRVQAIARDAEGNLSTEADKSPTREDAATGTADYLLDTAPPRLADVVKVGARQLRMRLSEPVTPSGGAGIWTVGGAEAQASGEGAERLLTVGSDLTGSVHEVSWKPGITRYRDLAGNDLPSGFVRTAPLGSDVTASAVDVRTVTVDLGHAATDAVPGAGLRIVGGPAISVVRGSGRTRTLELAGDLQTATPLVVHDGTGLRAADGTAFPAFEVRAVAGFVFGPRQLGAALVAPKRVLLSWIDDRNLPADVAEYHVLRDGVVAAQLPASARQWEDPAQDSLQRRYAVRVIGVGGSVSPDVETTLDPLAPNVRPGGGHVLSPDGAVALVVPTGAVAEDYQAFLVKVTTPALTPFTAVSATYELHATTVADDRPLARFERFACLSFRPGPAVLDAAGRPRLVVLRHADGSHRELATRTGSDWAGACVLGPGRFTLARVAGLTTRVAAGDPALPSDRFTTAVGLSQTAFDRAEAAVLVRADDFPDALASAVLSGRLRAPVLLSGVEAMPEATVLELRRLGVTKVFLAGGPAALSPAVQAQAEGLGLAVERLSGGDRYATAVEIAKRAGVSARRAYVASGAGFADALAAAAPSAALGRPILLTAPDRLPTSTLDGLRALGVTDVDLLGGSAAVSPAVEGQLRDAGLRVRRIAGADRYATAAALAEIAAGEGLTLALPVVASGQGTGRTSPDALAAGPIAALRRAPLLLVPPGELPPGIEGLLREAPGLSGVAIAGGETAVSRRVRDRIDAL